MTAFTDGSYSHTIQDGARAGCGVWFGEGNEPNISTQMPDKLATNNTVELAAVLTVISQTDTHCNLHIMSDSKYIIDGLTKHYKHWEDIGWINIRNPDLFKATIVALRLRKGKTTFEKVKGHSGVEGNEAADQLAANRATKDIPVDIDISIPEEIDISGTKLKAMTQAILYNGILENRKKTDCKTTNENLEKIAESIRDRIGYNPEPRHIWASLKNKDISKNIRAFM
jgi:ribonuclease HI